MLFELCEAPEPHLYNPFMNTERPLFSLIPSQSGACFVSAKRSRVSQPTCQFLFPLPPRKCKIKKCPPYPNAHRKGQLKWGCFSE